MQHAKSYLNFIGFIQRKTACSLRQFTRNITYTVRRGPARGMRRRGGLAFIPEWIAPPTAEELRLRTLDLAGKTIFDIGGFEGVMTLFFSRAAGEQGQVVVFEPNPANVQCIKNNIAANRLQNVDLQPVALGGETGTANLCFDAKYKGCGSINGISVASGETNAINVPLHRLDDLISAASLAVPDFVKIDVEGFETEVLGGMPETLRKHTPDLWIETHAALLADSNAREAYRTGLLALLTGLHYRIEHVETVTVLTEKDRDWPDGHLYCTQA